MSENNGHDDRARRAVELFAAKYGWAETLRRTHFRSTLTARVGWWRFNAGITPRRTDTRGHC